MIQDKIFSKTFDHKNLSLLNKKFNNDFSFINDNFERKNSPNSDKINYVSFKSKNSSKFMIDEKSEYPANNMYKNFSYEQENFNENYFLRNSNNSSSNENSYDGNNFNQRLSLKDENKNSDSSSNSNKSLGIYQNIEGTSTLKDMYDDYNSSLKNDNFIRENNFIPNNFHFKNFPPTNINSSNDLMNNNNYFITNKSLNFLPSSKRDNSSQNIHDFEAFQDSDDSKTLGLLNNSSSNTQQNLMINNNLNTNLYFSQKNFTENNMTNEKPNYTEDIDFSPSINQSRKNLLNNYNINVDQSKNNLNYNLFNNNYFMQASFIPKKLSEQHQKINYFYNNLNYLKNYNFGLNNYTAINNNHSPNNNINNNLNNPLNNQQQFFNNLKQIDNNDLNNSKKYTTSTINTYTKNHFFYNNIKNAESQLSSENVVVASNSTNNVTSIYGKNNKKINIHNFTLSSKNIFIQNPFDCLKEKDIRVKTGRKDTQEEPHNRINLENVKI